MHRANTVKDTTVASVLELIRAQAKARPQAIAVAAGNQRLTYEELDDRSTELAAVPRSRGLGTEVRVGLWIHRSPALAVATLGIWKAGGTFVLLDPTDPTNRLAMLLEDSESEFVVTHQRATRLLPCGSWTTLVLDDDGFLASHSAPIHGSSDPAGVRVGSEHLAYVIFTSGSTGRPKGVQITHANLLNLVRWHVRAIGVTASDRATMQASPGFDAVVWELFPYLCTGATVHVIEDEIRATPRLLRDWIVATGITISFLPTALAQSLVALPWPSDCDHGRRPGNDNKSDR